MVTGATGTIGRSLIDLLVRERAEVRAVTRKAQTANLPADVEVVEGDPARPDTLTAALQGVTGLFLNPAAVRNAAVELLALARKQGVKRVVTLSASNTEDDFTLQPSRFRGEKNKEVEDAAIRSGLEWVSLRPSSFASNTLQAWGAQIRAGDVIRYAYAAFEEAPIDPGDVAEVAMHALLTDVLVGRRLELTGPQSLSHEEMLAVVGGAIGRRLRYQEIPPEVARQNMIQGGYPEPLVNALLARYARYIGHTAPTTSEVEKILGRPARTYAQWVADHVDAFRNSGTRPDPALEESIE
jgi:uncharacterized protein YbjT (DUF2867 family)